jgi:hypothetical protein
MFQALFMSATALGRMAGAYWVGWASGHGPGECGVWGLVGGGFVLLWLLLLPTWPALHPAAIARCNGPNAVLGPGGLCTSATTHLAPDGGPSPPPSGSVMVAPGADGVGLRHPGAEPLLPAGRGGRRDR